MPTMATFDPQLDLVLERTIDVPVHLVWKAWTTPELLKKWFTPAPWQTVDCEIDLRPGGAFRTVMQSPDGAKFPNLGCYLEVVPNQKLVWTSALGPGYRPLPGPVESTGTATLSFNFTVSLELTADGNRTKYVARAMHGDAAACQQHAAMGFAEGWGAALDQLIAVAATIA